MLKLASRPSFCACWVSLKGKKRKLCKNSNELVKQYILRGKTQSQLINLFFLTVLCFSLKRNVWFLVWNYHRLFFQIIDRTVINTCLRTFLVRYVSQCVNERVLHLIVNLVSRLKVAYYSWDCEDVFFECLNLSPWSGKCQSVRWPSAGIYSSGLFIACALSCLGSRSLFILYVSEAMPSDYGSA